MKEKYSSPIVVSADKVEGKEGAFPAAELQHEQTMQQAKF